MIIKELGSRSIRLPAIGQGMGDYVWKDSQVEVLRAGIDLGMNFIDTAEIYGNGRSEEIIGKAIKGLRKKVIIGTKFSPEHNAYNNVLRAVEESLERLQTDYIDLYQLHWPNPSVPIQEPVKALEKLVKDGKVRCIGVSNLNLSELKEAQSRFFNEKLASLQIEYNLFDRSVEKEILPFCQRYKIIVIAYSPLDKGRIVDGLQNRKKLKEIADRYDKTLGQIALRWLISRPGVVAIPKSDNIKHVKENASAADFNLEEKDIKAIDRIFKINVAMVPPDKIRVIGQDKNKKFVYCALKEAIENKFGHVPGPVELSKIIIKDKRIKPVRLTPLAGKNGKYEYGLVEGGVRYWAWVIACGNELIPAYIREDR